MDAQRGRFVEGAIAPDLTREKANEIFDLLAKFADYGFNKSHAAAYALIAYQTAWLKANYPVEFLASSMTLDKGNTDKLAEFRNDARKLGVKLNPPSILHSGADFDVRQDASGLSIRLLAICRAIPASRRAAPMRPSRLCGMAIAAQSTVTQHLLPKY